MNRSASLDPIVVRKSRVIALRLSMRIALRLRCAHVAAQTFDVKQFSRVGLVVLISGDV